METFRFSLNTQVAALSSEAQAAYEKIHEVMEANRESADHSAIKTQIDAIVSGLPESVKTELESLKVGSFSFQIPFFTIKLFQPQHGPRPTTAAN